MTCPKSQRAGFGLAALDVGVAPECPPRVCPKSGCVADELSVDDVGEASFETAQRFSVAFAGAFYPGWAIEGAAGLGDPRSGPPPPALHDVTHTGHAVPGYRR